MLPIRFGAKRSELYELAIITVQGGTTGSLSDAAKKSRDQILAANRENLAVEVFNALEIPPHPHMRGGPRSIRPGHRS